MGFGTPDAVDTPASLPAFGCLPNRVRNHPSTSQKLMRIITTVMAVAVVAGIATVIPQVRQPIASALEEIVPTAGSSASHRSARAVQHSSGHSETSEHDNHASDGHEHHARHKIMTTSPVVRDVTLTQPFVCQIHSRRHIEIKALEGGYLESIMVNEGQSVRKGNVMFHILPTLYTARLDADMAEAELAQVEYDNTKNLVEQNIVSTQELKLARAKLEKAMAQVRLAKAEMNFADIKAPFDGIIDRLHEQEGSLIEEGSMLTTMSDNSVMWVYFNVPEKYYLAFQKATRNGQKPEQLNIKLRLANQELYDHDGTIGAIEADFDSETGNISFRADFPNPEGLLRHGQTGTVLINQIDANAIVIPQRATYEILAKKYVFVIDDQNIVHQREIEISHELEDVFVIDRGIGPDDKIVLEGVLQVRDGDNVDNEYVDPSKVMSQLKYHAE
jgi:membrane fusion protein (multidrug efflux system)